MLVGCEIKLDVGNALAARRNRAAIGDLALTGQVAVRVRVDIKFLPFDRKLDAGPLINPVRDVGKGSAQKRRVKIGGVPERKVEVFGKAVGFKKAFLETGAAFEYPVLGKGFVLIDASKNPSKNVVLFDNLW